MKTVKSQKAFRALLASGAALMWGAGPLASANAQSAQEAADVASTPVESDMAALSPLDLDLLARVAANNDDALNFLEKTVNMNSGTLNLNGVRAVGAVFAKELDALGFETEWVEMPKEMQRAGHLVARRFPADNAPHRGNKILLIGHLDTVFEEVDGGGAFRIEGDKAFGAGVADMKGGNVVVLYALKALHQAGLLDGAMIEVVFTGDEEKTGKPISVSRKALIDAAKRADVALNFEGGEAGAVVTSRRGSSGWVLTTTGRRAHSSGVFRDEVGAGAAYEMARILSAFYETLSAEKYLTFNPGTVVAGTNVNYDATANKGDTFGKTNVVAQTAVVHGDLRFISEAQKAAAREKMQAIVDAHLPQTDATIEFNDSYPAMSPTDANDQLRHVLSTLSVEMGRGPISGNDPARRGAADISFAAPYTPASMDGLGVRGGGAHTPEEFMIVDSLKTATERTALFIHRLTHADAPRFGNSDARENVSDAGATATQD